MSKGMMKNVSFVVCMCIMVLMICFVGNREPVRASDEKEPLSQEEYEKRFEEAVSLANLMLGDETFVNNKTYTAEQEKDLEKIRTNLSSTYPMSTRYEQAEAYADYIRSHMTLSSRQQTTTWQMLCDGDTMGKYGELQSYGNSENYVHAFRDLCVLANIPCFMLKDESSGKTIAMFQAESGWYFYDVADAKEEPTAITKVYESFSSTFEPSMITFEYDYLDTRQYVEGIYLDREALHNISDKNTKISTFMLFYDMENNMVKMEMNSCSLTNEMFYGTNQMSNSNGEPPKGWVEAPVDTEDGKRRIYRGYSLFGVLLKGRVTVDGTEYNMEFRSVVTIPYGYLMEERERTEEENAEYFGVELKERMERIAEAIYQDKSFIFDVKFTPEEEAFMRAAVEEATSREHLEKNKWRFDSLGYTLPGEGEPLSDLMKAYGILFYINEHIEYVDIWLATSYSTLKGGGGNCGGYSILFRDMCTLADIPCFTLGCEREHGTPNRNFSDHGYNMMRLDGKWYYVEPQGVRIMEKIIYVPTYFMFSYDTVTSDAESGSAEVVFVSADAFLQEQSSIEFYGYYYDFDENGELGVYYRDRKDVIRNKDMEGYYRTDNNGKLAYGNGFFTFESWVVSENKKELWLYEGYMQQGLTLEGRTTIEGKEYNFDSQVIGPGYGLYYCYAKEMLQRKWQYEISGMEFSAIPDQEYTGKEICPIPIIKHEGKILTLGVDYTITYKDNTELTNDYSVITSYTVEGIGDYTGTAKRYFNIVKRDISKMEVSIPEQGCQWNFKAQKEGRMKPEIKIDLPETEYIVNYENNTTAGEMTMVITGQKHSYGQITKKIQIQPAVLEEKSFRIICADGKELQDTYTCDKGTSILVQPDISVRWYDEENQDYEILSSYSDYAVTYENTDKVGTATIRIQGKGRFTGTLEKNFTIAYGTLKDISQYSEFENLMKGNGFGSIAGKYYADYTGEPVYPSIPGVTYTTEYTQNLGSFEKDVDFVVSARNNINAGEATLIIQGIGKYTGSVEVPFTILPKQIKKTEVSLANGTVEYNGNIQYPKVSVPELTEGVDYQVVCYKWVKEEDTYEVTEPVEVGYYSVDIKLITKNYVFGNYYGEAENSYRLDYTIIESAWKPGTTPNIIPEVTTGTGIIVTPGAVTTSGGITTPDVNIGTTNKPDIIETPKPTKTPITQETQPTKKPTVTSKPKVTIPKVAKVTKCKVTAKKRSFIVKWKRVSGGKGYQIQISTKKNFKGAKTISIKASKTSYKASKLKSKKKYYIRIRAYKTYKNAKGKTKKVYGKWVTTVKKTK